jgi:hypothetical protein
MSTKNRKANSLFIQLPDHGQTMDRVFTGADEADDYVSGFDYDTADATPESSKINEWAKSRGGWGAIIISILIGVLFFFLFFWLISACSQSSGSKQACCPCPAGVVPASAMARPAAAQFQMQPRSAGGNCGGCSKGQQQVQAHAAAAPLSRRNRRQVRLPGDRTLTGAPGRG